MSDGFLGANEDGAGRWQALGDEDAVPARARASRATVDEGREPIGPPLGVTASVQGDMILRTLLPLPLKLMVRYWPFLVGVVLLANAILVFIIHQVWGQGHAFKMNVIDPANAAFCSIDYDWYRNGDVMMLIPLIALPEVLRLRRFCLHSSANTFSAPLADLYSSISLLTPESWQNTLKLNAGRCALAIGGCIVLFVSIMIPVMLSSSMLHYPARLARLDPFKAECGSDWWFGQIPDIFLMAIDLPIVAIIFVPYFVVLHAAEGVRLALHSYVAEFDARAPLHRDESSMAETVRKHQALELLLEHATVVLEPALRWMLLFGLGTVLALLTWAWMEFSVANSHHSIALFLVALVIMLLLLPLLRSTENINAYQARIEKAAFSVGDPAALGSALPASIGQAAMLREYVREHSLSLRVGGLVLRPESALSSTSLISLFGLLMIPYFVLVMPQLFGDAHFNHFKKDLVGHERDPSRDPYNGTKPLCVFCGHCSYHGWCAGGYFAKPGYEQCRTHANCRPVTYAAEIVASGQNLLRRR